MHAYPIHVSTCLHNMQLRPVAIYLDLIIFKLDSKLAIYIYSDFMLLSIHDEHSKIGNPQGIITLVNI